MTAHRRPAASLRLALLCLVSLLALFFFFFCASGPASLNSATPSAPRPPSLLLPPAGTQPPGRSDLAEFWDEAEAQTQAPRANHHQRDLLPRYSPHRPYAARASVPLTTIAAETITPLESPSASPITTTTTAPSNSPSPTAFISAPASPTPVNSTSPTPISSATTTAAPTLPGSPTVVPSTSATASPLPSSTATPIPSPTPAQSPWSSSSPGLSLSPTPSVTFLPTTPSVPPTPSAMPSTSPTPSVTLSASPTPSASPSTSPVPRTQLEVNNQTGAAELQLFAPGAAAPATAVTNAFGDLVLRAPNGSAVGSLAFPGGGFTQQNAFATADGREVTQLRAGLGSGAAQLGLEYVYFVNGSGQTSFAGVTLTNAKGTVKYSVNITGGWPFAAPATAVGGFGLPFTLDIDAPITDVTERLDTPAARVNTYVFYAASLGVRYELQLLGIAIVDGANDQPAQVDISVTYAATSATTTRVSVMLGFPTFQSSLVYDPSLGVLFGRSPDDGGSGGSSGGIDGGLIGGLVGGLLGAAVLVVIVVIVVALVVTRYRRRDRVNRESAVAFGGEEDVEMETKKKSKKKASEKTWWDDDNS